MQAARRAANAATRMKPFTPLETGLTRAGQCCKIPSGVESTAAQTGRQRLILLIVSQDAQAKLDRWQLRCKAVRMSCISVATQALY